MEGSAAMGGESAENGGSCGCVMRKAKCFVGAAKLAHLRCALCRQVCAGPDSHVPAFIGKL